MNMNFIQPTGQPRYVTDFEPLAALWSPEHGLCFKADTSDGLVVVNVASGDRIAVPSSTMFHAAALVELMTQ